MFNRSEERLGYGPRAVFQPAGAYIGRGRRFACLRCVCLATGEDFIAVVPIDEEAFKATELIDCPACGYEHRAVTAETALDSDLIDREEFDFLSSPVELVSDGPGNETLRVKKKY